MTAQILDGRNISRLIKQKVKHAIDLRVQNQQSVPGLDVILVGNNPASKIYIQHKQRACEAVGIRSYCHQLPESTTEQQLTDLIETLNDKPETRQVKENEDLAKNYTSVTSRHNKKHQM